MTLFPPISLLFSVLQIAVEIRMPRLYGEIDLGGGVKRVVPSRTMQVVSVGWAILVLFNVSLWFLPVAAICLLVPMGAVQVYKLLAFVQKKLFLQAILSLLQVGLLIVYAWLISI